MKKIMMMLLMAVTVNAIADEWYDEMTGFTWYYSISGDSAILTGCSPKEGEIPPLPSVLGGKAVTEIGSRAFEGCYKLTGTLKLPDSVITIGQAAFRSCSGLSGSLRIPDGVITIAKYAFETCRGFSGDLIIPSSVKTIDSYAFKDSGKFSELRFPDEGCVEVGEQAFKSLRLESLVIGRGEIIFGRTPFFLGSVEKVFVPDLEFWLSKERYATVVLSIGNGELYVNNDIVAGEVQIPFGIEKIPDYAFYKCSMVTSVIIPSSVTDIGTGAFYGCDLKYVNIPDSVANIGSGAFGENNNLMYIAIPGKNVNINDSIAKSGVIYHHPLVKFEREVALKDRAGFVFSALALPKILSAKMRESDPTIMDVVYKVTSTKPTVKVRALAFQDGERSFAKVVRPETFVEDENGNPTAGNIGDGITANEEHTLSWKVSVDWNTTLAKVKFEVLAVEDEILPLELVTLPKTETQPKMVFSWNYVVPSRAFDALLWLYADKDLGLTLTDGVLKNGTVRLADGASCDKTSYDALVYIYGKMGYELLQGERLNYVRERSRLDLPGISERQYAVKVIEE